MASSTYGQTAVCVELHQYCVQAVVGSNNHLQQSLRVNMSDELFCSIAQNRLA
jgi:hypothetical protein